MTLKFLDQCGFCLMMTLCYTWFKRGTGLAFEVPTRWGSQGRINLIGTLSFYGEDEMLEIRELSGPCTGEQVIAYLETLAASCDVSKPTTVVMDNAAFHKGVALKARRADWDARGLLLRYLPAYCPCLNLIEGVWRRVKGFLMRPKPVRCWCKAKKPRRCYNSVVELRGALLMALKALGAVMI